MWVVCLDYSQVMLLAYCFFVIALFFYNIWQWLVESFCSGFLIILLPDWLSWKSLSKISCWFSSFYCCSYCWDIIFVDIVGIVINVIGVIIIGSYIYHFVKIWHTLFQTFQLLMNQIGEAYLLLTWTRVMLWKKADQVIYDCRLKFLSWNWWEYHWPSSISW